jgi:hypothetical protein
MNYRKGILTFVFALILSAGAFAIDASAQTGSVVIRRGTQRPVVVRRYVSPYWRYRYDPYWRYSRYYDPFYADFYRSPYERYLEQRYYLERELRGNQRELAEHREKYSRDGYISPKEREELNDDIRDVQKARAKLNNFLRRN